MGDRADGTAAAGRAAAGRRPRRRQHALSDGADRRDERLRARPHALERDGVHVALRSGRSPLRRIAARGVGDSSGQPRARGRAERHGAPDAAVGEPDLSRHEARLVDLRARAVRRESHRGHDLPGRQRTADLGAGGLRQPDRQGRHARHGRHLHRARRRPRGEGNQLEYDTLSDQYARFLLEITGGGETAKLQDGASRAIAGRAAAASARSPPRGSGRRRSPR